MKISLLWLREFVELSESTEELRAVLDDLGLVFDSSWLTPETDPWRLSAERRISPSAITSHWLP